MSMERLQQKRTLIDLIRSFFNTAGFFELETPLLVPAPGMEAHLHGFATSYLAADGQAHGFFLPTSPEFAIKKALARDYRPVFEIARVFRNRGELGPLHHPEFNMLEWYEPGDYRTTMERCESLLTFLAEQPAEQFELVSIDWKLPFQRKSVRELFQKLAGIDLRQGIQDPSFFRTKAEECLGTGIPEDDSFEDIFFRIWLTHIEPGLGCGAPVIVHDYPAEMAALSQLKVEDPDWCERWELYINGLEIANAFSELRDPDEHIRRLETANRLRIAAGYDPHPLDEELISAVAQLPPTSGVALGIERLLMALTGEKDIRNCFLQPLPPSFSQDLKKHS